MDFQGWEIGGIGEIGADELTTRCYFTLCVYSWAYQAYSYYHEPQLPSGCIVCRLSGKSNLLRWMKAKDKRGVPFDRWGMFTLSHMCGAISDT